MVGCSTAASSPHKRRLTLSAVTLRAKITTKPTGMKIENAKILVVDDDPVMRNFVVTLLGRLGAGHFQVAQDGRSGLQMAHSFRPDLIISDVHMEPVDGLDFVRNLRSQPVDALRKIPVLMLSADSSLQTLNESMPLGIDGYLIKPPSLSSLQNKIEQILNELSY